MEAAYGIAGAVIAQTAGIPQFLRMLKTRRARDVSLTTYLMLEIGDIIALVYFIRNPDPVGLTMTVIGTIVVTALVVITIVLRKRSAALGEE